ncbi:MAG: ferritin family protein [Alphaproteobacteria bacterium]|nr:ferritin family protein [Alphaproteobacteria bacterium]
MRERKTARFRNRRSFLRGSVATIIAAPVVAKGLPSLAAQPVESGTVRTLRSAAQTERAAYSRYMAFARRADAEGYVGISYLFIALATSEIIHAQNYERLLTRLGADITPHEPSVAPVADTKQNLIAAAEAELNSINNYYPQVHKQIEAGGNADAITNVRYSWESHRQHIEILDKIREYTPDYFEEVARRIDEESGIFYVCEICGSTTNTVPTGKCEICNFPVDHYRKIDPSTFLSQSTP